MGFISNEIRVLAADSHGCSVIAAALTYGPREPRKAFARVLLRQSGLLAFMSGVRHGDVATARALELLEAEEYLRALQQLKVEAVEVQTSKRGQDAVKLFDIFA